MQHILQYKMDEKVLLHFYLLHSLLHSPHLPQSQDTHPAPSPSRTSSSKEPKHMQHVLGSIVSAGVFSLFNP